MMLARLPFGKCIAALAIVVAMTLPFGPGAAQDQLAQADKRFQLNDPATVTVDQQIQALAYLRSAKLAGRDKEFGDSVGGAANAQNIKTSIAAMDANQRMPTNFRKCSSCPTKACSALCCR